MGDGGVGEDEEAALLAADGEGGGGGDGLGRRGGDSFGAGGGEQLRVATGDDGRLIGAVGAGVLIGAEGVVGVFFRVGSAAAMQAKHAAGGRRRRSRWRWRWRR